MSNLELNYKLKRRTSSSSDRRKSSVYVDGLQFNYNKKRKLETSETDDLPTLQKNKEPDLPTLQKNKEPEEKTESHKQQKTEGERDLDIIVNGAVSKLANGRDSVHAAVREICKVFLSHHFDLQPAATTENKNKFDSNRIRNLESQIQTLEKLVNLWSEEECSWQALMQRYSSPKTTQKLKKPQPLQQTPFGDLSQHQTSRSPELVQIKQLAIQLDSFKPTLNDIRHFIQSADQYYSTLIGTLHDAAVRVFVEEDDRPATPRSLIRGITSKDHV